MKATIRTIAALAALLGSHACLAAATPTATPAAAPGSLGGQLAQMVFGLLLVVGLIFFLAWLLRRLQSTAVKGGQVIEIVGSRAIGTIYTNTTGRPLHVAVTIQTQAIAQSGCRLLIGGVEVAQFYSPVAANVYGYLQGIVPPGATYQVTQASGTNTLTLWQEL